MFEDLPFGRFGWLLARNALGCHHSPGVLDHGHTAGAAFYGEPGKDGINAAKTE
jgi:hypothetical protein